MVSMFFLVIIAFLYLNAQWARIYGGESGDYGCLCFHAFNRSYFAFLQEIEAFSEKVACSLFFLDSQLLE
jgi:hypothetical protein